MAKKKGPQAWQQAAGGPSKAEPGYRWKPADTATPGTGKRRLKQFALLGGLLAVVAAFVAIVLLMQRPPQPAFVAIAADPAADAEKLDIPIDPYGWMAAKQLIGWAKARAKADADNFWSRKAKISGDENDTPTALPADPAKLQKWADDLASYDPVVIYVGLHGGVGETGPFLFTGGRSETTGEPNKLAIKTLLQVLGTGEVAKKKKVLLLDTGRLPPDPTYGQLHDGFAAALKGMSEDVAKCPNLVVICGADAGQRGWESEELQTTAFAHGLLTALRDDTRGSKIVTARQLLESARDATAAWARANRPTAQMPFVLPASAASGEAEVTIFATPAATPSALGDTAALAAHWGEHDKFAADSAGPAAYTPRLWRRYRELLLRYQFAVRAGDGPTANKLNNLLTTAERTMAEALKPPEFKSRTETTSLAMWSALERDGAAPEIAPSGDATAVPTTPAGRAGLAARELTRLRGADAAGFAGALNQAADGLKRIGPDQRPAEAHLPVMVRNFYAKVNQPPATEWTAAFRTQQAAERAALGLAFEPGEMPLSVSGKARTPLALERIWPVIAKRVGELDDVRRKAEDRLFSDAPKNREAAAAELKTAADGYAEAVRLAAAIRGGLDARDVADADLPFLARWVADRATSADDPDVKRVAELGVKLKVLTDALEKPDRDVVVAAAEAVAKPYRELRTAFTREFDEQLPGAAFQTAWARKQLLLATPFAPAADRMRLLGESRRDSTKMLTENRPADAAGNRPASEATGADGRQQSLIRAALVQATWAADPEAAAVVTGENLDKLRTSEKWIEVAVEVGDRSVKHARRASEVRPPSPSAIDLAADRRARSAILLDPDDKAPAAVEPALANRWHQWRMLLAGLAARAADDHWYDEEHNPEVVDTNPDARTGRYFRRAAKRYIGDLDEVTKLLPGQPKYDLPPTVVATIAASPLPSAAAAPFTWTSERRLGLELNLVVPKEFPVRGNVVGFSRFDGTPALTVEKPAGPDRLPTPLAAGADLRLKVPLVYAAKDDAIADGAAAGTWYFRGQWPTRRQPIAVRRRADLVLADPRPTDEEKNVSFSVRARNDLDAGPVAILIDYSGSMRQAFDGKEVGDFRTDPKSKYRAALTAVETAVADLPPATPLRVRVFSYKGAPAARQSKVVYEAGGSNPIRVADLLAALNKEEPEQDTPLVQEIGTAVREDFPDKAKTLIVVTDGVQSVPDNTVPGGARDATMEEVKSKYRSELTELFKDRDIALFVVNLGLSAKDKPLSDALFCHIDKPGFHKVPGRRWDATNQAELSQALQDAVRPKLRLEMQFGGRPPQLPPAGWPSRPFAAAADERSNAGRYQLRWSPLVPVGRYDASGAASRLGQVPIEVADGDRMLLGLYRSERGGVRVRRELFADFFTDLTDRWKRGAGNRWILTVPGASVNDQQVTPEFRAFGFVERIPPHRRTEDVRIADSDEETLLRQTTPSLLWWEVGPAKDGQPMPLDGTVTVRRRYAYAAPAWEITASNWPGLQPACVRIYPADDVNLSEPQPVSVPENGAAESTVAVDGQTYRLRTSIEPYPLLRGGREVSCLVVRVTNADPNGAPAFVRLEGGDKLATEQRFYFKAGASTAAFGELQRESLVGLRLRIAAVGPSVRSPAQAITLVPPPPRASTTLEYDILPTPYKSKDDAAPVQKCE